MDAHLLLGVALIGLGIGFVSGAFGKGGSALATPLLHLIGVPAIMAFRRSEVSNWTLAIGVPTGQLYGELQMFLLFSGIGALVLLGANIALAGYQSTQITQAVRALIPPALALGRGEVPNISPLHVREADDVAQAIDRAFHLLQSRTVERDDAQQEKYLLENLDDLENGKAVQKSAGLLDAWSTADSTADWGRLCCSTR